MNFTDISTSGVWFAHRRPSHQARLRLFCFPYAGGSAAMYRQWPDLLPRFIDVWPIQLPGHGGRLLEAPVTDRSQLLNVLLSVFSSYLDMPYAFFGHSMGAGLAFDLAYAFHQRNDPLPVHLFVSGQSAPQIPSRKLPVDTLSDSEFIEELRRLNGTPEEVLINAELLQLSLPMLRADFSLSETFIYKPQAPLPCPISAYGGLQDREVTREDLVAWDHMTKGAFRFQLFSGDHFFIHSAQADLLQVLTRELLAYR